MEKEVRLVFAPAPQMGHLVAMVELAKRILQLPSTTHHFTISVISIPPIQPNPQLSSSISSARSSVPNLFFLELQPIAPPHFPSLSAQKIASLTLDFYAPHVKSAISTLLASSTALITALVVDFFCIDLIDVAVELGIPPYVFYTSSASMLGMVLHSPTLDPLLPDEKMAVEMKGETIPFPGFASKLPFEAFPNSFGIGKNDLYRWFLHLGRRLPEVKGILVNTFYALQPDVIKALEEDLYITNHPTPPVYPIGPILSLKAEPKHACISWLDEQPRGSVVFLCFGSMGSFPVTQVREIATGLERSCHRFLWVLRAPRKPEQGMGASADAVLDEVLPDGFLEKTRGRGLVWPSYAPQADILSHVAVGGFVTHCGWNSCLEGVWFGVPMAAWPLYAEQHFNAFEMVVEMGVAVEVRVDRLGGNRASAEELERAVRLLMGEESRPTRDKVKELGKEGRRSLEEGGSSHHSLQAVMEEWSSQARTLHSAPVFCVVNMGLGLEPKTT